MKKILYLLLSIYLVIGSCSAFSIIHFGDYKEELKIQAKHTQESKYINRDFAKIQDRPCHYKEQEDYFIIEPICLRTKNYPTLGFREAVDLIRPYVIGFQQEYDYTNQYFSFSGTQPIINDTELSLDNQYHDTPAQKKLITYLTNNNIKIKIHKKYFAKYSIQDFTFYPNKKVTAKMGDCTKTNYLVSLSALQNLYLKPGEIFNLNQAISWLPGYCKKVNGYKTLPFYGGACGTAGQLFKSTLLAPQISILKRSPHIRRRADYYGEVIYGDDAAVSSTKELEIQNTSSLPLYFKTKDFGEFTYLTIISPYKTNQTTHITKHPISGLKSEVIKQIQDNHDNTITQTQKFVSKYFQYFKGGV